MSEVHRFAGFFEMLGLLPQPGYPPVGNGLGNVSWDGG